MTQNTIHIIGGAKETNETMKAQDQPPSKELYFKYGMRKII